MRSIYGTLLHKCGIKSVDCCTKSSRLLSSRHRIFSVKEWIKLKIISQLVVFVGLVIRLKHIKYWFCAFFDSFKNTEQALPMTTIPNKTRFYKPNNMYSFRIDNLWHDIIKRFFKPIYFYVFDIHNIHRYYCNISAGKGYVKIHETGPAIILTIDRVFNRLTRWFKLLLKNKGSFFYRVVTSCSRVTVLLLINVNIWKSRLTRLKIISYR